MVSLDIPCAAWTEALPEVEGIVGATVRATLHDACPALEEAEISIVLVDDATQRDLNHTWRDKNGSTNVLSFPATETEAGAVPVPEFPGVPLSLGDISLAFETIRAEAREQGKPLDRHLAHLVVHGVLHLLGYDHLTDAQAAVMETLEIRILARLGIEDPYALADEGESDR
jgi:probable rRNA maturation factor